MQISIRRGSIAEALHVSLKIPEFHGPPQSEEYQKRLTGVPHLILIAFVDGQAAGFKVGYEREGYFYSWMGGVLPAFRRLGIAKKLAHMQETRVREMGYDSITFKTRNQHKGMLLFALKNGFDIIGFKEKEQVATNRILLRKIL